MKHAPLATAIVLLATGIGSVSAQSYGPWSDPLPVTAINTAAAEGCPIEAPDGLGLYFASNRPGGLGKQDIWRAHRPSVQGGWEAAEDLPAPVNTGEFDYCPTPLANGDLLFVSSMQTADDCFPGDTPPPPPAGGPSAGDIFLSHEDATHAWSTPVNLGCYPDGPNTAGAEFSPSRLDTPDGKFLFFSSGGYPDSEGQDIYMSTMRADGTFGPGVRVAELSTAADDRMPNVRSDGLEIVFSSNRAGATAFDQDIYVATRANTHSPWSAPQHRQRRDQHRGVGNALIAVGGRHAALLRPQDRRGRSGRRFRRHARARRGAAADGDASRAGPGAPALGVLAALLAAGAWLARRAMRA
jgi:hypothetical protein